jgi:hypothetical protein
MITDEKQDFRAEVMTLWIAWRNPLNVVQAQLRVRESSNPYCRWAKQSRKIRARRANWNVNHRWAA